MITTTSLAPWQRELADAVTDPDELCQLLQLSIADSQRVRQACQLFSLRVPRGFIEKMQVGDAQDPLLLQVLPQASELLDRAGYSDDPLQEKQHNPVPGLLHKYHGRVLMTLVGGCAVNCRYCFRRHFPYGDNMPGQQGWQQALDYIAKDNSIHEVILSGGDPLIVKNTQLHELIQRIQAITHVHTLRFHTRLPIVLPSRIDDGFIQLLQQTRLQKVMVIHANHANELDIHTAAALKRLQQAQVTLLNQSVLLRGVNDNDRDLINLSRQLWRCGVIPYYLHLLDPVNGVGHFEVAEATALALHQHLKQALPGYCVPRLAREVPGRLSKTWL